MRRQIATAFFVVALLAPVVSAQEGESFQRATFLVIPRTGGEFQGGVTTLPAGLEEAASFARSNPGFQGELVVRVFGGAYFFDEPLTITDETLGDFKGTLRFQGDPAGGVIVTGGKAVNDFEPVADEAILGRLREGVRGEVLQADLESLGITDYGELTARGFGRGGYVAGLELFFNNEPMTLARYPNEGWMTIEGVPEDTDDRFVYSDDRISEWTDADDLWLHGFWTWDWADSYAGVAELDPESKTIVTSEPHGVYGYKAGQRFYALNVLEELDTPGEYYVDRERGILYFYPPDEIEPGTAIVSVSDTLIELDGASNIVFENLTFEASRGTAISIKGGEFNRVRDCVIRNTGRSGVSVNGGKGHLVAGCDIYHVAETGISLRGGDRETLTRCGHEAYNNHIHHYSRWVKTYRPAVGVQGVGIRVTNNLIHDAPHTGILLGGNEHLIEFNEIHDVCQETGDVGAFYMGRDWTARGTIIRHNYFHDIQGPYTHGAMAVYLDDAASGQLIYGNLFVRASRAAFIGGGRDNIVENNVFVECEPSVHIDARALGWAKDYAVKGGSWRMYEKLDAINHDEPPYSEAYPNLATILENEPAKPLGNIVRRNVSVGGEWLNLQGVDEEWVTFKDNWVGADPGFVNPDEGDYRFKEDSPVGDIGFEPIPYDRIGLER